MPLEELPDLDFRAHPERLDWVMPWGKYVEEGFKEIAAKTEWALPNKGGAPACRGRVAELCPVFCMLFLKSLTDL